MIFFQKQNRKFKFKRIIIKLVFLFLLFYLSNNIVLEEKYLDFLTSSYIPLKEKKIENMMYPIKVEKENVPLVYIYNTHDTEKYEYSSPQAFNIDYDVKFASYILSGYLKEYSIDSVVENSLIGNILQQNNWAYHDSYLASRVLLEQSVINYPSLKYFIDLHRDSVSKEITTTIIDGKNYARVLFVVGLEHENYEENLALATVLDERLKRINPTLSRGISQKSGPGVNGVYNQDFNSKTLLIELGGQYNYIEEVNNTLKVLASVLYEYIMEDE